MTRTNKLVLSVFLLFAALNLSACATKPNQAAVVEPAPSARATEQQSAPEPVPVVIAPTAAAPAITAEQNAAAPAAAQEQAAPAPRVSPTPKAVPVAASVPVMAAEQPAPAPKPVAKKHRQVKAPKVAEPAPVVEPEPVAAPAPVVQKEEAKPTPPPVVSQPVQEVAEPGFVEQYWLWILGLVVVVIAVLWMVRKKDAQQG